MKKIILVAVAAAAVAAPAHADSRGKAASTYVIERPDSSAQSRQSANVMVLRDRRDGQVAETPQSRR